ncbi:MAG: redoxin family protein [Hamadaea sp.]|uniref:winged helix-turn-helix transcriptional regulator n=1 Tax=Hamadaea sp. TaxID=2024425 RepID=UPI0017C74468|nr:winged helix-turn-helix transcriptional regulator [Hamadaea sp.]NUR70187.1 redoxin family protein [Hamadaea sp.]NUT24146.1 redoxin family protein [Hamadaea sp.]
MPRNSWSPDASCGVAQTVNVLGDGWSLLILRDIARGHQRFDDLVTELRISRKVLTERLTGLIADGVLRREPYQTAPVRYAYELTAAGRDLLGVVVALQDWGDRWLLGDGSLTATDDEDSATAQRVRDLVGVVAPVVRLPGTDGIETDALAGPAVVFTYPATGTPTPLPSGWGEIPGAVGCTLENRLFRTAYPRLETAGIAVRGVSTQRPDEQLVFATAESLPFTLLSDVDLRLTAALRLPVFRAGERHRLKRLILVIAADRTIRAVRYPAGDIAAAVDWAVETALTLGR